MKVFFHYTCVGTFCFDDDIANEIMGLHPHLVLILKNKTDSNISLQIIGECLTYLKTSPYFVLLSDTDSFALEAIQNGVSDYLTKINTHSLGMSLAKFEARSSLVPPKTICIKSYSDYHFINYNDLVYLKADNNTTDFKLYNNKIVTAYKTLKYFEQNLPSNFVRIHKSYIVNVSYISRIHFSKNKCYLNFNEQIPFSSTYRERVERILASMAHV
ncbi:LytR/AlgR family response regulator transcription factor [Myroides pelagicus]|uniref:DNA-binding response regulator n=1 Tax=Myroides pelagicus TaxID=270914 RepID=A0A7K1GRJ7_9FLAO|nr:LytTR family DNA-binding domain-containing protein [Myroides pelagicus]MTH31009.1 DNA-binding response regulator [Myroides pelagicus]